MRTTCVLLVLVLTACAADDGGTDTRRPRGESETGDSAGDSATGDASAGDAGGCTDVGCDDGAFCNGVETCDHPGAGGT